MAENNLFRISIEGVICVGKSFVISQLKQYPNICAQLEPEDLWRSLGQWNPLEKFYQNPAAESASLQHLILYTQEKLLENPPNSTVLVQERSLQTGYHIFCLTSLKLNYMSPLSEAILQYRYGQIIPKAKISVYLYMKCSESVAKRRIEERKTSEIHGSREYFHQLHLAHDEYFTKAINQGEIVVCIDANQSRQEITKIIQLMASEINALDRSGLLMVYFYQIKSVSVNDYITIEKLQAYSTQGPSKQKTTPIKD